MTGSKSFRVKRRSLGGPGVERRCAGADARGQIEELPLAGVAEVSAAAGAGFAGAPTSHACSVPTGNQV